MNINFQGKKALVTGGGRGIGREVCKALNAAGAEVFAVSKSEGGLMSLKGECPDIHTICCDLTDWNATKLAIDKLGDIDLLVNNAGTALINDFLDVTEEDYDGVMNVNLKAVFIVSQVVAKGMAARGEGGAIVNVSSQASKRPLRGHAVYGASKAALDLLTQTMAMELGPHKIRVNAVCPTVVMTDMGAKVWSEPKKAGPLLSRIPLGRFAEIQDVVEPILYLLSDKASMVTGTAMPVEGGFLTT